MTDEERLKWIEANQPKNVSAINAMRLRMGLELKPEPPKKPKEDWRTVVAASKVNRRGLRITPYMHWKNRGTSSN